MTSYFSASPALSSSSPVLSPSNETLSPSIGSAQRSNALSNRLTSVLSASYADSDIRDALETLDRRGVHNTADTRRQLRLDVQKEVIDCNGEIVKDFGKVADQLKRIGTVITSLNRTCEEMRKHINQAKQETAPVLEEASALMSQKQDTETKRRLLDAFTKHFIVPDEDLIVLTSAEEPVDDHFFDVLARVKRVHHDCEVLLGGENQRLGLEIMEQSSKQLNSAYQKLYKWIQKEFKSLNLEDPQINSSIRRALRVLAERPSLFHSCLDFFAEAREYILSDSFHYALTNAVSAGEGERNVKPIEFSAHDPLRYIGDMLAWVHSAAVSEREALEALFVTDGDEIAKGIKAGISSEPWSRVDGEEDVVFDGQKALNGLVDRDINGVSRSLRQRVELVIQGCDDPVTTYKVVNLLSFYRMTFSRLIGAESNLANVISSLETYTFGHFQTLLGDQVGLVSGDPAALTPPPDLSVPQFLSDALDVLTHLMKAYDASLEGVDPESTSDQENKFTPVLHVAFDPFLDLAKSTASDLSNKTSKAIYQTNILLAARSTIIPYQFACTTHLAPISTSLSTIRMDLLQAQHDFFLETSGLQDLLTALEPFSLPTDTQDSEKQPQQPPSLASVASLPAFQPDALSLTSQQLDDFLPSALMDATDNLKRVRNPNLVKSVTEEAVEAFCRDFEFVEGMIIGADEARGITKIDAAGSEIATTITTTDGDKEGEEKWSLRALFPRTTGEIRVLLS